jgi:hypothetical protein
MSNELHILDDPDERPVLTEAELAYHEYEHEMWEEDPKAWSPLITLEQLAARPKLEVAWYAPDWIPVGAKTVLCGEPKTGKTIFLFHLLKAIVNGEKFLGKQCEAAKVLYLTEQTEHEFRMQIEEVPGLIGSKNFYALLAEETPKELRTWQEKLEWAEKKLAVTKAKILVVDTFSSIACLPPNGENDAAVIQNHINQMNFLFKMRYLAVVILHHSRKLSDDPKREQNPLLLSNVRGSTAFVGGCGHIILMAKDDQVCTRNFKVYGRYLNDEQRKLQLVKGEYLDTQPYSFRR